MTTKSWHRPLVAYLILLFLYLAITVPLILTLEPGTKGKIQDEVKYHYATVMTFAEQFPLLNLRDYPSATTPLYHLIIMFAGFVVGSDLVALRFVNALISLLCLFVVFGYLAKRGGITNGLLFSVIFLLSPYFILAAVRLFTDNLGLLFAFLSIMLLDYCVVHRQRFVLSGIYALLAVLTRHVYVWLAGLSLVASLWDYESRRIRINLINALPAVIPIAGAGLFIWLWGGLTTPQFVGQHEAEAGVNGEALIYIVALLGLYGGCLIPWYIRLYQQSHSVRDLLPMALSAVVGALFLFIDPLWRYDIGVQIGALWAVAELFPTFYSSSILFWVLIPLGFVLLYVTLRHLIYERNYVMAVCLPLWILSNMSSVRVYQRYYEPFLLFIIGYTLAVVTVKKRWYEWASLLLLGFGLMAMSLLEHVLPMLG